MINASNMKFLDKGGTILLLLIPSVLAWFAYENYGFAYKAGVPISSALIIAYVFRSNFSEFKSVWFVIWALIFSAVGDWFLSLKGDSLDQFFIGIILYFFAHAGYLGFSLAN